MIELAEQHKRLLAIGHELRLSSLWGEVKQLVDAGAIGEPQYVLIELSRRPYRLGADGWRYDIDRVGNWILEEPIHFFDLARWYFASLGEPLTVYAQANCRQPDHPELQDNFSAIVDFPQGPTPSSRRRSPPSSTIRPSSSRAPRALCGRAGAARWTARSLPPSGSNILMGNSFIKSSSAKPTGEVYELHDQVAMMVRAVRLGGELSCTGEDGRQSVALCLAAQESVETGRVVDLTNPNDEIRMTKEARMTKSK